MYKLFRIRSLFIPFALAVVFTTLFWNSLSFACVVTRAGKQIDCGSNICRESSKYRPDLDESKGPPLKKQSKRKTRDDDVPVEVVSKDKKARNKTSKSTDQGVTEPDFLSEVNPDVLRMIMDHLSGLDQSVCRQVSKTLATASRQVQVTSYKNVNIYKLWEISRRHGAFLRGLNLTGGAIWRGGLKYLVRMDKLTELYLDGVHFTNSEELDELAHSPNLRVLVYSNSDADPKINAGTARLKSIGKIKGLHHVKIKGMAINRNGLAHLANLKELKSLSLEGSFVPAPRNETKEEIQNRHQSFIEGFPRRAQLENLETIHLGYTLPTAFHAQFLETTGLPEFGLQANDFERFILNWYREYTSNPQPPLGAGMEVLDYTGLTTDQIYHFISFGKIPSLETARTAVERQALLGKVNVWYERHVREYFPIRKFVEELKEGTGLTDEEIGYWLEGQREREKSRSYMYNGFFEN